MGSALSTFVGAVGSVKELIHVMVKMCDVFNKPPDHDGMGNAPKVGQNRDTPSCHLLHGQEFVCVRLHLFDV